ncbi:RcpC/CpaB family pilus assembly protein [Arthrobacter sp. ATA002]|uniref:RcpC/CpaB family pilus assembly protein n=1 Tax=Arthrobacter sp. ATA002 TaxID=2991715 RepID=UPI0022A7AD06|nr:RcpC/CpaB family pilus assembly protein [Arthrobacter sp. ATA002]WAP52616.1 RcpC/CpaB family pilus assembly protein [Arthrobacter sp. ATA002]
MRPADPAIVALMSPGQLVDVFLGSAGADQGTGGPAAVLASDAPILWTAGDGGDSWPGADENSAVVVLAAAAGEAAALAEASGSGRIHLVLTGG